MRKKKRTRAYYIKLQKRFVFYICVNPSISGRELSRRLGITSNTASLWMRAYKERGLDGLQDQRFGGKDKLTTAQIRELKQLTKQSAVLCGFPDEEWTAERLKQIVKERWGISYHKDALKKLVRKRGGNVPDERYIPIEIREAFEAVLRIMQEKPATEYGFETEKWQARWVCIFLAEHFHLSYSIGAIKYRLTKMGWSFQKQMVVKDEAAE